MKFKAGDKVRFLGYNCASDDEDSKFVGAIGVVDHASSLFYQVSGEEFMNFLFLEKELELVERAS